VTLTFDSKSVRSFLFIQNSGHKYSTGFLVNFYKNNYFVRLWFYPTQELAVVQIVDNIVNLAVLHFSLEKIHVLVIYSTNLENVVKITCPTQKE